MGSVLFKYTPGQTVTFYEEILDGYGHLVDDGYVPVVTRIILPDFSLAVGFPQDMTRLDVGLYYFQFRLPSERRHMHHHKCGCWQWFWNNDDGYCFTHPVIGTYFVDIIYKNPDTQLLVNDSRQIIVSAASGSNFITRAVG